MVIETDGWLNLVLAVLLKILTGNHYLNSQLSGISIRTPPENQSLAHLIKS